MIDNTLCEPSLHISSDVHFANLTKQPFVKNGPHWKMPTTCFCTVYSRSTSWILLQTWIEKLLSTCFIFNVSIVQGWRIVCQCCYVYVWVKLLHGSVHCLRKLYNGNGSGRRVETVLHISITMPSVVDRLIYVELCQFIWRLVEVIFCTYVTVS